MNFGKNEYLVLPDDTLIAMLFVGEIPIYWLTDTETTFVNDPKTIYGGTLHRFGIKIGLIDRIKFIF